MISCTKLTNTGNIHSTSQRTNVNIGFELYSPVFVKHGGSGSNAPESHWIEQNFKTTFYDMSGSGLGGNALHFYHSYSHFFKKKVTQG